MPALRSCRVLALILLAFACLAAGCPGRHGASGPQGLTLAYIGNFRGFQQPCNCSGGQDGGLPRIGSAIDAARALAQGKPEGLPEVAPEVLADIPAGQPVVLIDCGNFSNPRAKLPGSRAHTHLGVLKALGAKCAVVGSDELGLDPDDAKNAFMDNPLPLVSCNVTSAAGDIVIVPQIELAPGWSLVGVTLPQPGGRNSEWAQCSDPLEAVKGALAALPKGSRAIVACAQMPRGLADKIIALGSPALAAVIGVPPEDAGEKLLPAPHWRAQWFDFAVFAEGAAPRAWPVELSQKWPNSESIVTELGEGNLHRWDVARSDPRQWQHNSWRMDENSLPRDAAAPPAEQTYAGAESCKACHAQAYAAWSGSRHHGAYMTLVDHGEAQTMDCLECHTTGLLLQGGYDPDKSFDVLKDPNARVGCESCHGPGLAHVQLAKAGQLSGAVLHGGVKPAAGADSGAAMKIQRSSVAGCVQCHDSYNSPHFDAQTYWAKIKH